MKIVMFDYKNNYDLEHEIIYIDPNLIAEKGIDVVVEEIQQFEPDLIIEREYNDGRALFTQIYKQLPGIPKAYWLIDGHCNLIDHIVYAKQFDHVFCAQSWFIPMVQREVLTKVFYLPLCHTQTLTEYEAMLQTPVEKDIDFSFIGNIRSIHVERKKHVGTLLALFPKFFARQASYADTLTYLRRSKVTFNCSLNNDLNFRVWEGLACGAIVVTDVVTDIDSIFGLQDYLALYDKLLPDFRNISIPQVEAQWFIKTRHTLTARMNQMLTMIDSGSQYEY